MYNSINGAPGYANPVEGGKDEHGIPHGVGVPVEIDLSRPLLGTNFLPDVPSMGFRYNPATSTVGAGLPGNNQAALDYVVMHELAHTRHLNHSKSFWRLVARYLPDYKERQAILRDYQQRIPQWVIFSAPVGKYFPVRHLHEQMAQDSRGP